MRIILLIFFLISFTNLNAQKYTEQYIQEANVIGLNWKILIIKIILIHITLLTLVSKKDSL